MAAFGGSDDPTAGGNLFFDVMDHSNQFSHVTTPQGAFDFNQNFERPMLDQEATAPPQIQVEIIDAVTRKDTDWSGLIEKEYVEYVLKLSIAQDQMKIIGKRYSELCELHAMLQERRLTDGVRTPPFPEKNIFGNSKDPNNEFVLQRKEALAVYLKRLFEVNPGLAYEPAVLAFFELEELATQAAIETSRRTAAYQAATIDQPPAPTPAPASAPSSQPAAAAQPKSKSPASGFGSFFGGGSSGGSKPAGGPAAPTPTSAAPAPVEAKPSAILYDV